MDFTQPWEFGDVTFIVEDKKIHVNKAVLAMSSEVFKVMFTLEFAEKTMTEIPLPDKKFDDFLELMQILHPPHDQCVDGTNAESLLQLADEYQIHHMVDDCEQVLVDQPPSIHNLILADRFSLSELRQICMEHVKDVPHSELEDDPEFKMVEKDTLLEVFRYKSKASDVSKNAICDLMSQPPSIKNLFLAEKYNLGQVYEKCLKHVKETPLAKLKREPGSDALKASDTVRVLTCKVEHYEELTVKLLRIADGDDHDWVVCGRHYRGTRVNCSECAKYNQKKMVSILQK